MNTTESPENNDSDTLLGLGSSAGLGPPATCGACKHAEWSMTPTGRVRRRFNGYCRKSDELLALFDAPARLPPCIRAGGRVTTGVIWFDNDASGCPLRA